MTRPSFTVTQKIAAGYLLIIFFSLVALAYALFSLHRQTSRSQQLVAVDFRAFNLLRDLRQTVLAQERLEKQLLVLRDPSLAGLLDNRRQEFLTHWQALTEIPLPEIHQNLPSLVAPFLREDQLCGDLLQQADWQQARACVEDRITPAREVLLMGLDTLTRKQKASFDLAMQALPEESKRAYQLTLALVLAGLALSAPVALTVILGIHRSTRSLVLATQSIAEGRFDHRLDLRGNDEFALLGQEFTEMGKKLKDLEQRCLDANPLTRLPGNRVIDQEIEARLASGRPFAHIYIDLDNFKVFSDRYGYQSGSKVLSEVGNLVRGIVRRYGTNNDFVGHIGGDDYVVLTDPDQAEAIGRQLISEFDRLAPSFYSAADRQAGRFRARDRFGTEREFSLITMSVSILSSTDFEDPSPLAISRECAKVKEHLKEIPGSNLLVNRRTFP